MQIKRGVMDKKLVLRKQSGKINNHDAKIKQLKLNLNIININISKYLYLYNGEYSFRFSNRPILFL
jgi:hypothetical protein